MQFAWRHLRSGAEATQLPRKHILYRDHIIPSLDLHNTSPECKLKPLTDNECRPGTTMVFMIVIASISWDDLPHRTEIVQLRVPDPKGAMQKQANGDKGERTCGGIRSGYIPLRSAHFFAFALTLVSWFLVA